MTYFSLTIELLSHLTCVRPTQRLVNVQLPTDTNSIVQNTTCISTKLVRSKYSVREAAFYHEIRSHIMGDSLL